MTTGEKFLLLLAAAFAVSALLFTMYLPLNTLFMPPPAMLIALYALAGVFFLLYAKFRKNERLGFIFLWLLCAVFIITAVLFFAARLHPVG